MSKSEVVASVNIESFIASKTSWEPGSGLVKLGSRSLDTLLTLVWRLLCFSLAVVYLLQRLWQGGEYSNFHCSNWRRNGTKQLPVNLSRRLWRQEIPKFLLCWRKTGSVTCGSAEQKLHRHQILMRIVMGVNERLSTGQSYSKPSSWSSSIHGAPQTNSGGYSKFSPAEWANSNVYHYNRST